MTTDMATTEPHITSSSPPTGEARPTFSEAFKIWLKIGCINFGGPAGQIAMMHRMLVDEKKWVDEQRFLHALNFCMLLPGPEAQKLATYIGWSAWHPRRVVAGICSCCPARS
jgi:chromate transporter